MTTNSNCTICQNPVRSWFSFMNSVDSLTCGHEFHHSCLVNLVDSTHVENPQSLSVQCPNCREYSLIPTTFSPERIAGWVETARRSALIVGHALSVGCSSFIGIKVFQVLSSQSDHPSYNLATLVRRAVPPVASLFAFTIVSNIMAISCEILLRPNGRLKQCITKVVTAIYNWKMESAVSPMDVTLHQTGLMSMAPEDQLCLVLIGYSNAVITLMKEDLQLTPFDADERQVVNAALNEMHVEREFIGKFSRFLQEERADLYLRLSRLGGLALYQGGNEEIKLELKQELINFQIDNSDVQIACTTDVAVRIGIVQTLDVFKEMFDWKTQEKEAEWKALLTQLQQERYDVDLIASVMEALLESLPEGQRLSQIPLLRWLGDEEIHDAIFDAIYGLRKEEFVRRDFELQQADTSDSDNDL